MENKNKLIAEFFTGKKIESHHNSYHRSWNELMPVIQKCYESEFFGTNNLIGDITHALIDIDIEETFEAVVKFIEYYNSQKL